MIRLSKSAITDAEKNAVMGVLDREYLGMGQTAWVINHLEKCIFLL
jgi:hypothetical protein